MLGGDSTLTGVADARTFAKSPLTMNFPKRQHIVPRFILENFTDETGLLYCYHKLTDTPFAKKPREALKELYFYTEIADDGTPTNQAERRLQELEDAFKPLSTQLITCARSDRGVEFSASETEKIRDFVLVQFRRSRRVNTLAHQVSKDKRKVKDTLADLIFDNPLHPKLDRAVESKGFVLGVPQGLRKAFIIGDSPVALLSSLEGEDSEITMPIASNVAVALSSTVDRPVLRQFNPWQVGVVNKQIAKFSNTIASDRAAYTEYFRNADLDDEDWPGA